MCGKREPGVGPVPKYVRRYPEYPARDDSTSRREVHALLIPGPKSAGPASGRIHPRDDGVFPIDMPQQVDSPVQKYPPEVRRLAFSEQFDRGFDPNHFAAFDQFGKLIVIEAREQAQRSKLIDACHNVATRRRSTMTGLLMRSTLRLRPAGKTSRNMIGSGCAAWHCAAVRAVLVWGRGMQIPKPTEQDKDFLRSIVPDDPRVELKPMFGNLGAFVNGNMFAGLFGSTVGVRLIDDASREELAAIQGTGPFGPAERPMGGYLALPPSWSTQPKLAANWVSTAMSQVAALPPKTAKQAKPKAKSAKLER